MQMRTRRIRSLHFDCMERREVLSGLPGAPPVEAPPLKLGPVSFELEGTGVAIGQTMMPGGTLVQTDVVKGSATWLDPFAGQLVTLPIAGGNSVMDLTDFYSGDGSSLRMTVGGFATGVGGNTDHGPRTDIIQGRYYVTGGTGSLTQARSAGTFVMVLDLETGATTLDFEGQIAIVE